MTKPSVQTNNSQNKNNKQKAGQLASASSRRRTDNIEFIIHDFRLGSFLKSVRGVPGR